MKNEPTSARPTSFSLQLPKAPQNLHGAVKAWRQDVEILTYLPGKPEVNPMFLEKRVYQGSSGRVYPLPFIDRIDVEPNFEMWKAIHIENEYLRLMILPQIGGRIHIGYDKRSGYDFFYRQNVIKPALVGLAGPWISGGVEFNWPQHHRPATFMPVETEIETEPDGSVTVWCSDHDPMLRMKGMHGVCLRPGRAVVELKVRLFNRTPLTQTFLWWANVAAHVHEKYQSFFPTDVRYVADHARRAITSFPLSNGVYYGVDYAERARSGVPQDERPRMYAPDGSYPPNDLSWYSNIPVPTSYMITGTEDDFFGGYDHQAQAGMVHVASHHIAPGKKQWTWGNHEFGYAWDRSLTDHDGPYIELMAGVYTDNQPDFSFLAPWETKIFTQRWYPIRGIGVPQAANADAALHLSVKHGAAHIGLEVTRPVADATIVLEAAGTEIARWDKALSASAPVLLTMPLAPGTSADSVSITVIESGRPLISYQPFHGKHAKPPTVAEEPPPPEEIGSIEELYLTGLHLEQYRHATRLPEPYWLEGLRRDPGESRLHNALGLLCLRRGEFEQAAKHFQFAIDRLTRANPNPRDGEPFYNLGLARRYQGLRKDAYDAFYKATWNAAWRGPAYFALAECDMAAANWPQALDHVQRSLRADADNLNARNLLSLVLGRLGDVERAEAITEETLTIDPLDVGARWRRGMSPCDGQECLDLAFDMLRAGQDQEALRVLDSADIDAKDGSAPILLFTIAYAQERLGLPKAKDTRGRAASVSQDYCFPSRLEEMIVLEAAVAADSGNWSAHYLLGNLFYDKRRYEDAIAHWEVAARLEPAHAVTHRNLGIAYFNVQHNAAKATKSFDQAFRANPMDARVLYERDQLWKRAGETPEGRLKELLQYPALIDQRDDLTLELATLYNHMGKPEDALCLLTTRKFQPWEGGEGLVLAEYERARLLLGQRSLESDDPGTALTEFEAALRPPQSLNEAKHLLSNRSNIYYWLGEAYDRLGSRDAAHEWWMRAARERGDFQKMSIREVSDLTFWSGMAFKRLGRLDDAAALFSLIHDHSVELEATEPKIDYFATSLPAMLLFEEDIVRHNRISAFFLRAQALYGLDRGGEAEQTLRQVLQMDGNHSGAADLLRQIGKTQTAVKPN